MIKLYNQDCMEALKEMKANQYDLAIVDPPYGIGDWVSKYRNENKTKTYKSGNKIGKQWKRNTQTRWKEVKWNNNIPNQDYFIQLKRVSKEQIIWGANYYNCFNDKGGAIVWNKKMPVKSNMSICEIASYSKHKKVAYYEGIWQNVNRGEITIHPCQKPVKLYEWLLMNYAKAGDKILDTHLGSGSIAIACHNLGYNLDGYEIDETYYEAAKKRLNQHQNQLTLL